jgi:hypothetical protein
MLIIIVIIVVVLIIAAVKLTSRPKEGDELFGAPTETAQPPIVQKPQEQQPTEEETKEETKQVYCENCQKLIPADSVICPYCGTNPFERTF